VPQIPKLTSILMQVCPQIGAPGYPPIGPDTANFNLVIGHDAVDPVSGSVPMRAYVCQITRVAEPARQTRDPPIKELLVSVIRNTDQLIAMFDFVLPA
jgi:hypothetical protein